MGPMANEKIADSTANEEAHWDKTTKLMLTHLGIWFFFGYIVHMFVVPLNKIIIPILGFPLGFYKAAQGSLIVFVVMLFLFAQQQNAIDREFGYAQEEGGGNLELPRPRPAQPKASISSSAACTAPMRAGSSHSSSSLRYSNKSASRTRSSGIFLCSSRLRSTPSSAS